MTSTSSPTPASRPSTLLGLVSVAALLLVAAHASTITSITPNTGSLNGWTRVSILGTGFDIRGRSNLVYIGSGMAGVYCDPIPNECTTTRIVCLTPEYAGVGPMPVTVNSFGYNAICQVAAGCNYQFTIQKTPTVTLISPQWLIAPANITVYGTRFSQGDASVAAFDFTMWIGDEERCNLVSTITGSSFICNVVNMRPGLLPTTVILGASGKANIASLVSTVAVLPSISAVTPSVGSLAGGQTVTIYGTSFSPDVSSNYVTIHGAPCIVDYYGTLYITCKTTPVAAATTSASRIVSPNVSSTVDAYYNLPAGYDLDLYFVGTIQYLSPDSTAVTSNFNTYIGAISCEQCGFRVTSQFVPTFTGNHTFSLNGDDWFEMWLSDSSEPVVRARGVTATGSTRALDVDGFNPRRIISYQGCCTYISSAPQYLVAGKTYWLRMFVKNGYGALGLTGRVSFNNLTNVPLETMLYNSADYVSPVQVLVNDMQALPQKSCLNFSSCDYNFVASATPTVTGVSPTSIGPQQSLTITGTGFDTSTTNPGTSTACAVATLCGGGGCACATQALCGLHTSLCSWSGSACVYRYNPPQCFQWSLNTVTVGGQPCNVTSQTSTQLVCTMPFVTAGSKRVIVSIATTGQASGVAKYVNVLTVVDGISPSSGSINGGNVLSINGFGFDPASTQVQVGNATCAIVSVAFDLITCIVPSLGAEGAASVRVLTSNARAYILPTSYQYDAKPVRPGTTVEVTESSITPINGPANGATRVFVTLPTAYSMSSSTAISVVIGGVPCAVRAAGSNSIQCFTGVAAAAGTFLCCRRHLALVRQHQWRQCAVHQRLRFRSSVHTSASRQCDVRDRQRCL
ncbi:membrane-associated protein, putative [Bodo saltans]|uniref:Membrane-associated protein, putative n=1 Tax=Bodo saltans TaxID=75058 RepID=A0A0S4JA06_BODSA|nr:membrane-associated protein, putative [Bodo saltans]|eukprot:CUG86306.1 membrane-associated protein, putative [Bodo saltans]